MIERFIDPDRIDPSSDCIELNSVFSGERVKDGKLIHGFEFVEPGKIDREGVEIVGKFRKKMGFHVIAEGISDESAQALESLFSEVISRMKGVEYRFRKDNVVIAVSHASLKNFTPECVGDVIFRAIKSVRTVRKVKVRIICDSNEFENLREKAARVHALREIKNRSLKDEDVNEFYLCESCKVYLPYHACIITPERPSPCGTVYSEAKSAVELDIVGYYSPVARGRLIDSKTGEYQMLNEEMRKRTESRVDQVKIHSVLENPPLTGNFAEAIVFYIPERNGFGIADRTFKKETPIGLKFEDIEKFILGRQIEGFVGVSFSYLRSGSFLKGEGGWRRVVWVSPRVYEYISGFLPESILNKLRKKMFMG